MDELTKLTPEEMEHLTKEQVQDVLIHCYEALITDILLNWICQGGLSASDIDLEDGMWPKSDRDEFHRVRQEQLAKIERMTNE